VPSLPNELVDAVPERVAPVPVPAAPNTRAVDDAIAAGMRLKTANGAMLHKPGSSKVFKLSTAQKAYYQKVMARLEREAAPVAGPSAVAQDAAGIVPAEEAAPQNPVVPDVAHAVRLADNDMLYPKAEAFVRENATASAAALQQHLKVGYNRAQRLLEQMEHAGTVSPMASNGARSLIAPAPAAGDVQVVAETAFDIAAHESATSPL
ncbi:DNA translocase FtsK, partial [Massilia sp. CCM 8734]|uniref:DNA translocase FtsK n=1 Tax=Massilia sp. CCM 8734 TaxID=2609283 RepID=UPI001695ACA2